MSEKEILLVDSAKFDLAQYPIGVRAEAGRASVKSEQMTLILLFQIMEQLKLLNKKIDSGQVSLFEVDTL